MKIHDFLIIFLLSIKISLKNESLFYSGYKKEF